MSAKVSQLTTARHADTINALAGAGVEVRAGGFGPGCPRRYVRFSLHGTADALQAARARLTAAGFACREVSAGVGGDYFSVRGVL